MFYYRWPLLSLISLCTAFCAHSHSQQALDGGSPTSDPSAPYVLSIDKAPTQLSPGGATLQHLAHPRLHKNKQAYFAMVTFPAGTQVPEHRDPTEEYLYVLEGSGTLHMDDVVYEIKKGMAVYMPANAKVKFTAGRQPVKALQIFAPSGPEAKYKDWKWVKD